MLEMPPSGAVDAFFILAYISVLQSILVLRESQRSVRDDDDDDDEDDDEDDNYQCSSPVLLRPSWLMMC